MAAADVIVCLEELGKRSLVKPPGGPAAGKAAGDASVRAKETPQQSPPQQARRE